MKATDFLTHDTGRKSVTALVAINGLVLLNATFLVWLTSVIYDFQIDPNWYQLIQVVLQTMIIGRAGQVALTEMVKEYRLRREGKPQQATPLKPVKPPQAGGKPPQGQGASFNFTIDDFDCKDGTPVPAKYRRNVEKVIDQLRVIWEASGQRRITISSGYRTAAHNKASKGARKSQHLTGSAVDFKVEGMKPSEVKRLMVELMDDGRIIPGGYYAKSTFVHYDIRGKKTPIKL
jgi:hypothetical protein